MYGHNSEESYAQYQHDMAHMHQPPIQPAMPLQEIRPMSQHGFPDLQPYPTQYPNSMPQYPVQNQHMHHIRHASEQYEGSPAPDDSGNENGAARRKKGNATSLANDQELRRLLQQYSGKTLPEVASEVQKNEGSGGKAEKAKQVFAMLWYVL
jgi:regulatory factor X, other